MKVMVFVKASAESEAGTLPPPELFREMGRFNEELVKAGVMLAGEGLQPSSKGKRVRFAGKQRTVVDGPFAETKELVAGFWLWQVKSMDEAVEWIRRSPFQDGEIEIRPVSDPRTSRMHSRPMCGSRRHGFGRRPARSSRRGGRECGRAARAPADGRKSSEPSNAAGPATGRARCRFPALGRAAAMRGRRGVPSHRLDEQGERP